MKIFGGGGSRNGKPTKKTAKKATPKKVSPNSQTEDISYVAKQMKQQKPKGTQTPKKAAKVQKKPKAIVTKVLCVIAGIIALTIAGGATFLFVAAKKPDVSKIEHNIPTSSSGDDELAINLNVGDRIDDFFTFAVCATDIDGTRTDNIMVVAFDTNKHTVSVMNIPRDTMSNVNKTGASKKINAAYSRGIEQTKKQIAQVMGFIPDKYMVVDFQGIADIVDAIGGVDYEIPFPMMYKDPAQDLEINFPVAGMRHLNGEEVVEFLRWRKNGPGYTHLVPDEYLNGDETRIAKQQEFLTYLARQVLTPKNAFKFKDIADAVFNNVETDITTREMIWLAGQAFQVNTQTGINMFTLPGYSAMSTAGTNTALSFYFVNESEALTIINQYFNPYDKPIEYLDLVSGPTKPEAHHEDYDEDEEESTRPSYDDDDEEQTSSDNETDDTESSDSSDNNGNSNGSSSSNGSNQGGNSQNGSDNSNSGSDNSGNSNNGSNSGSDNSDNGSDSSNNGSDSSNGSNSGSEGSDNSGGNSGSSGEGGNGSSTDSGSDSGQNTDSSVDPEA